MNKNEPEIMGVLLKNVKHTDFKKVGYCMYCGKYMGGWNVVCESPDCYSKYTEAKRAAEERRKKEADREWLDRVSENLERLYRDFGFVKRYRDTRFSDLNIDEGNKLALNAAYKFVHNRTTERALILVGEPGTGKTMLASATINELMLTKGITPAYLCARDWRSVIPEIHASQDVKAKANELKDHIRNSRLVLLDDLGYEGKPSPKPFIEFLSELVNRQYNDTKYQLIVTSEHSMREFVEQGRYNVSDKVGTESLIDRLRSMAGCEYRLSGGSWRADLDGKRKAKCSKFKPHTEREE